MAKEQPKKYIISAGKKTNICPDTSCRGIINFTGSGKMKIPAGQKYIGFCSICKADIFQEEN